MTLRYFNLKAFYLRSYIAGLMGVYGAIQISGHSLSGFIFPLLYIYSILLFALSKNKRVKDYLLKLSFLLLTGLLISSLFSYNPVKSTFYVILLFVNFLFSFALYQFYDEEYILKQIFYVLKLLFCISLLLFFIYPSIIIYNDPMDRANLLGLPNYKGLFPHKIHAGFYNVIGVLLAQHYYKKERNKQNLLWMFIFSLSVLLTGSSLGLVSLLVVFIIMQGISFIKRNYGYTGIILSILIFLLITGFVLKYNLQNYLFTMVGRDESLTGRTTIWEYGIDYILKHPILGGGFETFFDEDKQAPAQGLWKKMIYYKAPSFHNGYIEILAEGGILGGLGFIYLLLKMLFKMLKRNSFLYTSIILLCLVCNLGAAVFVKVNTFFLVFLLYLILLTKFPKNDIETQETVSLDEMAFPNNHVH
ncbi:MAG TPA: O-antigen ligase family protein [Parafilimonas sp.]|nr:O-antigen ligase family protein [Parafilimonas sp.]